MTIVNYDRMATDLGWGWMVYGQTWRRLQAEAGRLLLHLLKPKVVEGELRDPNGT